MKIKNIIKGALLSVSLLTASSCNKEFLDINVSPNLTTDNPANLILPSVQSTLGFTMGSDVHRYTLLFVQQMAAQNGRQTEEYDLYRIQPTEVNTTFRANFYAGVLADIEEILRKDPAVTHPHYFGIAKIMKAYTYQIITDLWGDVPFTEAIQGRQGNYQPALDRSSDIYPALITLLDEAVADMKQTSPLAAPATDDYIYGGTTNAIRWIRAANTLKLRLYLHMANVPGFNTGVISSFVSATPATEFMTATADNFQVRFDELSQRQNPIHQFILFRTDDIAVGATIVDLMNSKADPRRSTYFTPAAPFNRDLFANPPMNSTSGYVGLRNGTGGGGVNNGLSRLHTYVRGPVTTAAGSIPTGPTLGVTGLAYGGNAPIRMLLFSEYNFIRAEMAMRYGVPGDAQTFYRAGIRASFADAGLTTAQADAYLATDAGTLAGSAEDMLKQIIEEKYVANYMVAVEPWNDWRRTGYPSLTPVPAALNPGNNGRVPRVLPYPQQEVDANPKITQRTNLSENPVFWDVRSTGPQ
jgi:hypothetical protein